MEYEYAIDGELGFTSYLPDKLKEGMTFLSEFNPPSGRRYDFFTLKSVPEDEEAFMRLHGAPVKVCIIPVDNNDDEEELINYEEVKYFLNGDKINLITDEIINNIINDYDGFVGVISNEDGEILYSKDGFVILEYIVLGNEEDN